MTTLSGFSRSPEPATACFSVQASAGPGVLPRVLGLFAKQGLVPDRLSSVLAGDECDELHIDLQLSGLAPAQADRFAAQMRQMVEVALVLTYAKDAESGRNAGLRVSRDGALSA